MASLDQCGRGWLSFILNCIYRLIESCKLNQINPYEYLRDVLTSIPNTLNRDI
jgi:hypothetical protein